MAILTGEQDPRELDLLFEELDWLTRKPFARLKEELDAVLAQSYGIAPPGPDAVALSRPVLPEDAARV